MTLPPAMEKKRFRQILLLISLLLVTVPSMGANTPNQLPPTHITIAPMLQKTMPAVVSLLIQRETPLLNNALLQKYQEKKPLLETPQPDQKDDAFVAAGSGVIIDAQQGLIVTNAHVVKQAKAILVTLSDHRRFLATEIGHDNSHDLALLTIHADQLTALPFGDSSQLKIGDFVAAIGSPFHLQQTVTSGIISALNRSDIEIEGIEDFIQTDASINPGNSGGALVNMEGALIGINTAIVTPDNNSGNVGIGLAIPSNTVKHVIDQLLKYGEVKRGILGIQLQTINPNLATAFGQPGQKGAVITFVTPFSPADKAGLKSGDIITTVNEVPIKTAAQVKNAVALLRIGANLNITFIRHHETSHTTAVIADQQIAINALHNHHPFLYGVTTRDMHLSNPKIGQISGAQVVDVNYDSPAWISSLRAGDMIVAVNNVPIHNILQLTKSVQINHYQELLLTVLRNSGYFFIVIH